jgi:hypothetical protein
MLEDAFVGLGLVSETFVVGGVDAGALVGDVDGSFDFVGQGAAATWTRGLLSEGAFGEAECPGTRCGFLVKIVPQSRSRFQMDSIADVRADLIKFFGGTKEEGNDSLQKEQWFFGVCNFCE